MSCFTIFSRICKPKLNFKSQIIQLKGQRDELNHYKEILEQRIQSLIKESIKHARDGNKERALLNLRRKDLIKKQLFIVDEFIIKVLTVISDTEMADIQLDVLNNLEIGAKLLATISHEIRMKDIHAIRDIEAQSLDDIADAMGLHSSQCIKEIDDESLLKELDMLTGGRDVTVTESAPARETIEEHTDLKKELKEPVLV